VSILWIDVSLVNNDELDIYTGILLEQVCIRWFGCVEHKKDDAF